VAKSESDNGQVREGWVANRSGIMAKSERDKWLSLKGWVAKLVACPFLRQLSVLESRHPLKIINGRHVT
jgi:hypothetical protein